ncbi:anti-anti-sigma factor [Kitasatospora sp. SolWspMP-SS2h]|nr:anti-anti-sigma factor [Kitasatospora sp. SolWspMP-SS2h]
MRQALESGACRLLVLDLARLDFCDSSGLHELLHARANPRHVPLVLAAPSPRFVRLLELAGAEGVFVLAGGVQSAIDYHRLESAWQRQLDQEKPGEDAQEPGGTP